METAKYYDIIAEELFNKHSLAALVILITSGRELDFRFKGELYSITWIGNSVKLENAKSGEKQIFSDVIDIPTKGTINNFNFMEVWDEVELGYLY